MASRRPIEVALALGLAAVLAVYLFAPRAPVVTAPDTAVSVVPAIPAATAPTAPAAVEGASAAVRPAATPPATPAPAKKKAKAAPSKTAKPRYTEEEYATAQAQFYGQRAECLRGLVDLKIDRDVALGVITDWGNVLEAGVCGQEYLDPATGRVPPYRP